MSRGRDTGETCQCSFDDGTPLSIAVIECITEADGGDPENRPPLHDAIDPEAFDNLFQGRSRGEVTFSYLDYEITVNSEGKVTTRQLKGQPVGAD